MTFRELGRVLRARWVAVVLSTIVAVLGAVIITVLTTPMYQASTRLFVSTTMGASASELYQGNRLSQERVLSYTQLLMGETLARRTNDKLGLEMDPETLRENVKATAKLDTVLIDVDVLDESPVRARDIANALSDEFVVMVSELETPRPGAKPDARVVVEQRASIPDEPVIPKSSRNIAAGVLTGLLFGIVLAYVRDLLDNTVKDRDSLEALTGTGLVGSIPFDRDRTDLPAISFEGNNSAIAEAFRKLRTNLRFLGVDNPPRVILVTSTAPSEGKSTTALNIALALAEAEHSVVLVDGDMRRPSLNKYLDLIGNVGFSTVLSGRVSLEDALQVSQYPRLSVLTAGMIPPNPSELLGSKAAQSVLKELASQFDYVIVDSSPLLAVTDGAILAAHSDGALIIARFGKTKRDQLKHAAGTLTDVGAPLLGAVFTMTPTRGASAYAYSYSYYGQDGSNASRTRPSSTAPDPSIETETAVGSTVPSE